MSATQPFAPTAAAWRHTAVTAAVEADVLAALREVDDPELGVDVVALGLVRAIDIDGDRVAVVLAMTTPTCPLAGLIAETAAVAVGKRLGPGFAVRVTVDRSVRWSPDDAEPEVRARFARRPSRLLGALRHGLDRLTGRS